MKDWEQKDIVEEQEFKTQQINHKVKHEGNIEGFRATLDFGKGALKSAFIMNGGASISWLAFIGVLLKGEDFFYDPIIFDPLLKFSFGLLIATVAHGVAYLGQVFYMLARHFVSKYFIPLIIAEVFRAVAGGFIVWSYIKFYQGFGKVQEIILFLD